MHEILKIKIKIIDAFKGFHKTGRTIMLNGIVL